MRRWSILAITAATAGVIGCAELDPDRRANAFEFGYVRIAEARRDPELCYRIALDAHSMAALNPPGNQVSLVRSNCLFGVALQRRDPALCNEVHPINTWLLDGSANNPEACRAAVQSAMGKRRGTDVPAPQDLDLFFGVLGYSDPIDKRPGSFYGKYLNVVRTPEFGRRTERLPDFSRGDDEARRQLDALLPQCHGGGADWLCQAVECALDRGNTKQVECEKAIAAKTAPSPS
jgi:hypothetical protein